jgi:hypothetical protein
LENNQEEYSDIESDIEQEDIHSTVIKGGGENSLKIVLKENKETKLCNNNEKKSTMNKFLNLNNQLVAYNATAKDIIGDGYISLLHAYCRDTLFKKIKILSEEHLEGNGVIIQSFLERINYSSNMGNKQAFINAVRTEIRKTINSRRNYVKREMAKMMMGKQLYFFYSLFYDIHRALITNYYFSRSNEK